MYLGVNTEASLPFYEVGTLVWTRNMPLKAPPIIQVEWAGPWMILLTLFNSILQKTKQNMHGKKTV